MSRLDGPGADLVVIYDGQCPFCSAYVRLVRLKHAVGGLALLDARKGDVAAVIGRELGLDLNEGMLALYGGHAYYGYEAMNLLSVLSSRSGLWNRALAAIFRSKPLARALYPFAARGARRRAVPAGKTENRTDLIDPPR
jgi:predicted DCC family thiol-disulfide oxidoreductase YuxK